MKLLIFLCITLFSFNALAQYLNEAELEKIIHEIATPISNSETKALYKHLTFPFKVGEESYSQSQLTTAFKQVFLEGYNDCLQDPGNYQMAMPDDHTWYLAVCFSSPEGYEASVFSFRKKNGVWMLESVDLQRE